MTVLTYSTGVGNVLLHSYYIVYTTSEGKVLFLRIPLVKVTYCRVAIILYTTSG